MSNALAEAEKARKEGEIPVGAIVVSKENVLSRAHNETIIKCDPTAHAEIIALREACLKQGNPRLEETSLYVTLEPCAMCLGAMVQARIKRLIFGALDPKSGAVDSIMVFPFEQTNHRIEITGGIMKEKCGKILKDFFQELRF